MYLDCLCPIPLDEGWLIAKDIEAWARLTAFNYFQLPDDETAAYRSTTTAVVQSLPFSSENFSLPPGNGGRMVIVFAVGNEGRDCPGDISGLPTVIAVGSTNAMDQRAPHSNWGSHLDIMAPSNNACPFVNPDCGTLPLPS